MDSTRTSYQLPYNSMEYRVWFSWNNGFSYSAISRARKYPHAPLVSGEIISLSVWFLRCIFTEVSSEKLHISNTANSKLHNKQSPYVWGKFPVPMSAGR